MTTEKPPCYGVVWDDAGDSACRRCSIRNDCLALFATSTLAQYQAADINTPEALADVTGVSVEGIKKALQFQTNIGVGPKPESSPKPEPSPEPAKAPPTPAKKTKTKAKGKERAKTWDPKHDAKRWKRERERSALIAQLTPGMLLRQDFKGEVVEVKVMADGYLYGDKKYPTLYAVAKEVTGTIQCPKMKAKDGTRPAGTRALSNWSATRFFKAAIAKVLKGKGS